MIGDQMNANAQTPKPLALTDRQLRLVQTAARAVPVAQRDTFLRKVAAHLTSEPSDHAVQSAVNSQLDLIQHNFLNDSLKKIRRNQMNKHYRNDDDAFDERGLLRDGKVYRAKLTMMDHDPTHRRRVTDGSGDELGLHRPGWRIFDVDDAGDVKAEARRRYEQELAIRGATMRHKIQPKIPISMIPTTTKMTTSARGGAGVSKSAIRLGVRAAV
jgi:hypothetical protein